MAFLVLVAAVITVFYWVVWFADRSRVASVHTASYYQFEDAFPFADGWLVCCLVAAAITLVSRRPMALFWLLAGGGAGLYLFAMDTLYDIQHGVWEMGGNGLIELGINVATVSLSLAVLRWSWRRREGLLHAVHPESPG